MVDLSIVLYWKLSYDVVHFDWHLEFTPFKFFMCLLCIQQFSYFQNYYFNPMVDGVV
jgi:hypothetical protein